VENVVTDAYSGLWDGLRGARIFMTGGTGFVGLAMLEQLAAANERLQLDATVVVLTRDARQFAEREPEIARHEWITAATGDIRSFEYPPGHFSHVIHAATDTQPARSREDRVRVFDTIVDGTKRALEAAKRCDAARFLMVSTGAVYGRQPAGLSHLAEDYPGGPDVMLPAKSGAEAKRAAESLCAVFADDELRVIVARPFAFVGPHLPLDMHYAVGNFIRDALAGGPVRVLGDGTAVRSYMYSSDLSVWLWTMLVRGRSLHPYNVGSERAMTITEVAHAVARVCGGCAVHVARRPQPDVTPDRYVPATARARTELGLTETVPFEEALARTVAWYRTRGTSHVAH
jgi:dTDP-glucose 4,6-dehydratase